MFQSLEPHRTYRTNKIFDNIIRGNNWKDLEKKIIFQLNMVLTFLLSYDIHTFLGKAEYVFVDVRYRTWKFSVDYGEM